MKRTLLLLAAFVLCIEASAQRLYVKKGATGTGDGSSWTNAYAELGPAMDLAATQASPQITEIWVAAGTYKPTKNYTASTFDIYKAFVFPFDRTSEATGLKLYGGFNGTETALNQRNWSNNPTILSGDFNDNDVITGTGATLTITGHGTDGVFEDNAAHVLVGADYSVVDGFIVTGGGNDGITASGSLTYTINGINKSLSNAYGQGMGYVPYTSALQVSKILNTVFYGNAGTNSATRAGAVYCSTFSVDIINCAFINNRCRTGGAIYTSMSSSTPSTLNVINTVFVGNYAGAGDGGAITFNSGGASSITNITNCTFFGNASSANGGALNSGAGCIENIKNSIFVANTGGAANRSIYKSAPSTGSLNATNCIIDDYSTTTPATSNVTASNVTTASPFFYNSSNPVGADGKWFTKDDGLILKSLSPGLAAGDASVTLPTTDIMGSARPSGPFTLGAYELTWETLPVSLANFTAVAKNNNTQLNWEVLSTLNFSHFEVEKSSDGTHFTKLINVAFRNVGSYTYTDYMAAMGISNGYIYYRLKLVDNDGSFSYSDVRALKISTLNDNFKAYPSPFKDKISLNFNVDGSKEITATLSGTDGKVIVKRKLSANNLVLDDLESLPKGIYILNVINGLNNHQIKVVKK